VHGLVEEALLCLKGQSALDRSCAGIEKMGLEARLHLASLPLASAKKHQNEQDPQQLTKPPQAGEGLTIFWSTYCADHTSNLVMKIAVGPRCSFLQGENARVERAMRCSS
jgi:hypothetical protein